MTKNITNISLNELGKIENLSKRTLLSETLVFKYSLRIPYF